MERKTKTNPTKKRPPVIGIGEEHYDRNANWQESHLQIINAYAQLIHREGRVPKLWEVVKETGLSHGTVRDHIKIIRSEDLRKRFESLSLITDKVMLGVARSAIKGDTKAAELFFEIVEGHVPQKAINLKISRYNDMTDEELEKENGEIARLIERSPRPIRTTE